MTDRLESVAAAVCFSVMTIYLLNEVTSSTVAPSLLFFAGIGLMVMMFIFQQSPE